MPGKGRVKTTERSHLPAVLERLTPAPSGGGTPPPLPDATGGGALWRKLVLPGPAPGKDTEVAQRGGGSSQVGGRVVADRM